MIAGAAVVLAAAMVLGLWFRVRARDDVRVGVSADEAQNVDFEGLGKKKGGRGKWKGGGSSRGATATAGSRPQVAGGGSCEAAQRSYVLSYDDGAPPDLSAGAYARVPQPRHLLERLRRATQHVGEHLRCGAKRPRCWRHRAHQPRQWRHRSLRVGRRTQHGLPIAPASRTSPAPSSSRSDAALTLVGADRHDPFGRSGRVLWWS